MNSDQKLAKRYWEQKGDSLHLHQTEIWKDIIILFSKKYLMKKKFLVMKVNPQQWKKILAVQLLFKFFFQTSNWKNKTSKHIPSLAKTKGWQRMQVLLSLCKLPSKFCITAIHQRHRARDLPVQLQKIPSKCKSHQTIFLFKSVMVCINYRRFGVVAVFINVRLTWVLVIQYFQISKLNFKLGKRFAIFKYKIKQPYFI